MDIYTTVATELWASFTKNEKGMVRFGIFPAEKTQAGEEKIKATGETRDVTRKLAVALMDCAKADGGMRA
jgi:hypothetical protein